MFDEDIKNKQTLIMMEKEYLILLCKKQLFKIMDARKSEERIMVFLLFQTLLADF